MTKLAKYVLAGRYGKKGLFGIGSNQKVINDINQWEKIVQISSLLIESLSKEDLVKIAQKKYDDLSKKDIESVYDFLTKNHFLMKSQDFNSQDRNSRANLYYRLVGLEPQTAVQKLKNTTIAIVGCGGIGNYLSQILATLDIGTLILIDNDTVELSNISRQFLFSEHDISCLKIDVIERELTKRNSKINVIKYPINIECAEDYKKIKENIDLLLLSADTPAKIVNWTNEYCVKSLIPYLNIGYINDIAVYGPFVMPHKTACFECSQVVMDTLSHEDILFDELKAIESHFKTASFPTVNALSASIALNDVFKFICGYGEILSLNKRIGIHSLSLKIETQ